MKKRLLSLALTLVLLAALVPVSAYADNPIFDRRFRYSVTIDPPEKGGTIHSVLYELNYEYGPIYRFSYNTLATTISTYTWYDENGQIIAENSGLTVEDPRQMLGKSYRLEIQALPYRTAAQATQSTPGTNYFYATVETDYRGSKIKRFWQNDIGGYTYDGEDYSYEGDGSDDLNYPSFRHYIYKGEHFFKFEYTFDPVCLPVGKDIDVAVTAPETEQPLDFSAVLSNTEQLAVKDTGDNFHLHGVSWTDKTEDTALSGGSFKAGHDYDVSVYVEPANEFYYFDAESLTGATVNGAPAQVRDLSEEYKPLYEITCSFTLPEEAEEPEKKPAETKTNPFADVKESDYFYDAVLWAYYAEPQITKGMDDTHFGQASTVTRGQAVTFLWRAMGEPEPSATTNPFEDVKETDYFYKAVLWAGEKGVTLGTDATHFTPNQTCSTAHILTFLYRTLGIGDNGWYAVAEAWAQGAGLMEGHKVTVSPEVECPRADVVYFLHRALTK